ncbi:MAG: hypothetical protein J5719_06000 [Bacteroidales bacterium]|nr:hypothetical protein [Bacteroidales bacterium]
MKKFFVFLLGMLTPFLMVAQTVDDIGKIVIGVKVLPSATKETIKNKELLQNKLKNLVASAGFSSYGNNTFILTPSVSLYDVKVAEGGMKDIYVATGEIFLTVQERDNGTVFSSVSFPIKGSGLSQDAALKNGVQKITYGDMKPFFDESKTKILEYYNTQQDALFANADRLVKNKDFDAAIACLMTIPTELTDLYKKAYAKACDIYMLRDSFLLEQERLEIKRQNDEILVKARSMMAAHDAVGALRTLWGYQISNTEQDNEYKSLLKTAEARITMEEKAAMEQAEREYKDNIKFRNRLLDLESKRIEYSQMNRHEMEQTMKAIAFDWVTRNL